MSKVLLTEYWRDRLVNYNILFVGFSGGLDSTVLLHCLANEPAINKKLRAVHVHHGLSNYADVWQSHCQQFCESINIPLMTRHVKIQQHTNIEERARLARYQVFHSLLEINDGLLLAHHCDDQAETVLLHLLRGAGIDGLAAMTDTKTLAKGELVRPFLQHPRQCLEAYANQHQLSWIDDESNENVAFSRNFLRQKIMPLLQERWPKANMSIARAAKHCQHAKINLEELAKIDGKDLAHRKLELSSLYELSRPRLTNVLRTWLQHNELRLPSDKILNRLIDEMIIARPDALPEVQWGDIIVRRYQQTLYLVQNKTISNPNKMDWTTFPAPLPLSRGEQYLSATKAKQGIKVTAGQQIEVKFRQGGEILSWRGQTKLLKKLLQEWRVPPWQRDLIPLIYIDSELAAVVGFAISDHFYSTETKDSIYHIEVIPGASSG